jgi:hypothetical protein
MISKSPLIVFFVTVGLAFQAAGVQASGEKHGCFNKHITDALKLFKERYSKYGKLTQGKSNKVLLQVMASQTEMLPVAWFFDIRARKYQNAGVPVMCDDFVSMSLVPAFKNSVDIPGEPIEVYVSPEPDTIIAEIENEFAINGFEGVRRIAEANIEWLKVSPAYHCMLRHMLESIRRAARLAPSYISETEKLGMKSSSKLSWDFIRLHFLGIRKAIAADDAAAPIQALGIPILCQDIPPID